VLKLTRRTWLIVIGAIVAIGLFAAFGLRRKATAEYFTARVERGDVHELVEATGTINAVTTVQVGSQVSGRIAKLYVDFNAQVKAGQVLAQIDPEIFEGNLLQARADLENAQANLTAARANLEKARASAVQTKAEYERTQALAKQGVMSQQQLDVARANAESADAAVSAAEAQVKQAQAQVSQRSAAVQVAQTNLKHTIIRTPIDGTVVSRDVDVGQTVAASLQAPTLFTIAQDLTKMQVYAKTDESDVGEIKRGQRVTFKVDAFPRETFWGRVVQVRMNATTVQNVVTYDTVIEFDNPEMKLFPGMTAYVTIPVASAMNVLKIPNGALRFQPDMSREEVVALYQKHGIPVGGGSRRAAVQQTPSGNGAAAGDGDTAAPQQARQRRMAQRPGSSVENGAAQSESEFVPREPRLDVAVVWKLAADKSLIPVQVKTGITDHTFTVLERNLVGELKEGEELVVGSRRMASGPSGPPGMGTAPRMGGGGPRR